MADSTTPPLLTVNNLRTHFRTDAGTARAVDGVSFDIKPGECVALVGESGCGKSVTSLSIMRLLQMPPAFIPEGEILFNGRNLLKLPEKEMCQVRGAEIAMIFQEPQSALNPVFTCGDQIAEAYATHHPKARAREAWEHTIEAMRQVNIPDPERRALDYPHQLSGGMKQRICIAMALICSPKLIIADEPTTALDVTIQAQILELLKQLQQERHLSLLLITHDLGIVAEMAERTFVMYAGKIVEKSSTADLFRRPLHPYTQGLLRARPGSMSGGKSGMACATGSDVAASAPVATARAATSLPVAHRLAVIPGMVPAATQFQDDCRFNPRCPLCTDICRQQEPPLEEYGIEHRAACFHTKAEGIDAWKEEPASQGKNS